MNSEANNTNKLAYSTRCLPGSVAEQKEKDRIEEFQRNKAVQRAEEEKDRPQAVARREEEYLADCKANKERMEKQRAARYPRSSASRA